MESTRRIKMRTVEDKMRKITEGGVAMAADR